MRGNAPHIRPGLPRWRTAALLALSGIAISTSAMTAPTPAAAQTYPPGGDSGAVKRQQFVIPVNTKAVTALRDRRGSTVRVTRKTGSSAVVTPGNAVIRRSATTVTVAAGPTTEGLPDVGLLPFTVSEATSSGTLYSGPSCLLSMLWDVSTLPAAARTPTALGRFVSVKNNPWDYGITPTPLPDAVVASMYFATSFNGKPYVEYVMVVKGSCATNQINATASGTGLFRDQSRNPVTTASWTSFWDRFGEHFSKALIAELAGYVATAAIASAVAFAAPELYASAPNTVVALAGCFGGFVTEIIKKVWVDKNWAWADALSSCAIKAFVSVGLKNVFEEIGKNMIPALAQGATRGWSAIHGSRFGRFIGESLARIGPWVRQRYGVASVSVTSMLPDVESNLDSRWAFVQDPLVHECLTLWRWMEANPGHDVALPSQCYAPYNQ